MLNRRNLHRLPLASPSIRNEMYNISTLIDASERFGTTVVLVFDAKEYKYLGAILQTVDLNLLDYASVEGAVLRDLNLLDCTSAEGTTVTRAFKLIIVRSQHQTRACPSCHNHEREIMLQNEDIHMCFEQVGL